jgi:Fic family protein
MQIIIYITLGLVVGYLLGLAFKKSGLVDQRRTDQKKQNLDKIMDYLQTHDQIKNDDVEHLLNVSNATAERYLDELEKQGALTQVGEIGQGVYYKKK